MPQCGYSGTMVNILQSLSLPFETVDVLADDRIRQGMKLTRGNRSNMFHLLWQFCHMFSCCMGSKDSKEEEEPPIFPRLPPVNTRFLGGGSAHPAGRRVLGLAALLVALDRAEEEVISTGKTSIFSNESLYKLGRVSSTIRSCSRAVPMTPQ